MLERCRSFSELIGIFPPFKIFSPDFLRQKSPPRNQWPPGRPFRADRIAVKVDRFQPTNGATHCVWLVLDGEAHRRVPCPVGVKWDKGRKRRRADKWKWKEGADENKTFWVPTPAPPVDNFFLHFPPINNIGWTKKKSF